MAPEGLVRREVRHAPAHVLQGLGNLGHAVVTGQREGLREIEPRPAAVREPHVELRVVAVGAPLGRGHAAHGEDVEALVEGYREGQKAAVEERIHVGGATRQGLQDEGRVPTIDTE